MKIAVTGDIHLTAEKSRPERWGSFKRMLNDVAARRIDRIIVAGDLFNDDYHNYSKFDKLVSNCSNTRFLIIPGNHDFGITQKAFTAENILVFGEPKIMNFEDSRFSFFFLPYRKQVTMGEEIESYFDSLPPNRWILIGHGDWADTIRTPNPIEPGIYMPLSRKDIKNYKPALTILGHIHKPMTDPKYNVRYIGSPCGLDITETGRRRYLIIDTETAEINSIDIDSEIIYFDETIVVFPMENEESYWQKKLERIKEKWDLDQKEKAKAVIRVKISGCSSNKRKLKKFFEGSFRNFSFWKDGEVDVSEVDDSDNYELLKISERVSEKINKQEWEEKASEPTREEILSKAIRKIYTIT